MNNLKTATYIQIFLVSFTLFYFVFYLELISLPLYYPLQGIWGFNPMPEYPSMKWYGIVFASFFCSAVLTFFLKKMKIVSNFRNIINVIIWICVLLSFFSLIIIMALEFNKWNII